MGFTSKTMAEAAVRRLLPKDEHIVMAWIGGVVGIVGLSKLTSKTPPTQSVPVASGSNGMEDLFKQYPELQSALGTSSAPEPVVGPKPEGYSRCDWPDQGDSINWILDLNSWDLTVGPLRTPIAGPELLITQASFSEAVIRLQIANDVMSQSQVIINYLNNETRSMGVLFSSESTSQPHS